MNPRHIAISTDVFEPVEKFSKKHGLKLKSFYEEAAIKHLDYMQKLYDKS